MRSKRLMLVLMRKLVPTTRLPGYRPVWHGVAKGVLIGVWHGVSKRVEDGRRLPALQVGHCSNGHKAISGVTHPQGVKG
jgi:hypothetical protein